MRMTPKTYDKFIEIFKERFELRNAQITKEVDNFINIQGGIVSEREDLENVVYTKSETEAILNKINEELNSDPFKDKLGAFKRKEIAKKKMSLLFKEIINIDEEFDLLSEELKLDIGLLIDYFEHCHKDEVRGTHHSGVGYNPNGVFCGECAKTSCKGCINEELELSNRDQEGNFTKEEAKHIEEVFSSKLKKQIK